MQLIHGIVQAVFCHTSPDLYGHQLKQNILSNHRDKPLVTMLQNGIKEAKHPCQARTSEAHQRESLISLFHPSHSLCLHNVDSFPLSNGAGMPTSNNKRQQASIPMMLHALAVLSDPLASVR